MKNGLKIVALSCALMMMAPALSANCKESSRRPCRGFCNKPAKQALAKAKTKRSVNKREKEPVQDENTQVMRPEETTTSITSSIRVLPATPS